MGIVLTKNSVFSVDVRGVQLQQVTEIQRVCEECYEGIVVNNELSRGNNYPLHGSA